MLNSKEDELYIEDGAVRRRSLQPECDAYDYSEDSILKAIAGWHGRVLNVKVVEDGFVLEEACDEYFSVRLTRAAFKHFIQELQELLDENPGDGKSDSATA
jgi:hypothetical protein